MKVEAGFWSNSYSLQNKHQGGGVFFLTYIQPPVPTKCVWLTVALFYMSLGIFSLWLLSNSG